MVHLEHGRVVRVLGDGGVGARLALALCGRVTRVRRDFRAGRAERHRVLLHPPEERGLGFEVIWWPWYGRQAGVEYGACGGSPDGMNLYSVPSTSSAVFGMAAECVTPRYCASDPEANLSCIGVSVSACAWRNGEGAGTHVDPQVLIAIDLLILAKDLRRE